MQRGSYLRSYGKWRLLPCILFWECLSFINNCWSTATPLLYPLWKSHIADHTSHTAHLTSHIAHHISHISHLTLHTHIKQHTSHIAHLMLQFGSSDQQFSSFLAAFGAHVTTTGQDLPNGVEECAGWLWNTTNWASVYTGEPSAKLSTITVYVLRTTVELAQYQLFLFC